MPGSRVARDGTRSWGSRTRHAAEASTPMQPPKVRFVDRAMLVVRHPQFGYRAPLAACSGVHSWTCDSVAIMASDRMICAEFAARLTRAAPSLKSLVDEHIADNDGEVLLHPLLADVRRYLISAFYNQEDEATTIAVLAQPPLTTPCATRMSALRTPARSPSSRIHACGTRGWLPSCRLGHQV